MIINPFPMFGWNGVVKVIKHVAMAVDLTTSGGHRTSNLHYRVSADGLRWQQQSMQGDLASYTKSNGGPGAFQPSGILLFKGDWYAFGTIWTSSTATEGALFRSSDGRQWDRVSTGYDTSGPAGRRGYVYADGGPDYLLLLKDWGGLAFFDGSAWSNRSDVIGYEVSGNPALSARGVLSLEGGIVVVGAKSTDGNYRTWTASTPSGTFTDRGMPVGAKNVNVVTKGNIALILGHYNASIDPKRSSYAALDDVTSWANANFDVTHFVQNAFYALGAWHAGSAATWSRSEGASGTPGVGGWGVATVPWASAGVTVHTGYEHDDRAFVHYGNGLLATSDNGEEYTVVANTNLAAKPYFACVA